jgi:hypothetical protein
MFTFPIGHFSSSISGQGLELVVSSTCCDLDATLSGSYGGSGQTWTNLTTTPADGTDQTEWDAFLGADISVSTDDPTFTGSAGDSAAYFSFDGGDYFQFKAPPALVQEKIHKTAFADTELWIAMTVYVPASATLGGLFGNGGYNNGTEGWCVDYLLSTDSLTFKTSGGTDFVPKDLANGSVKLDDWNVFIITLQKLDGDTIDYKTWVNTSVAATEVSNIEFDETPVTANANVNFQIGKRGNNFPLENNYRIASFSVGNGYLTDDQAIAITKQLETRHNRLYTAYNVLNASYDSKSFNIASEGTAPQDMFFNADRTKMFVLDAVNRKVFQYSVSDATDISTASYDTKSFDTSGETTSPTGVFIKADGTKMYVLDGGTDVIYQYSLSTAWDISTASYDSVSFSISGQDTDAQDIFVKADGTKFYIVGNNTDIIYQYSMSVAFDLSTASYDSKSFSIASEETAPKGMVIDPSGTRLLVTGSTGDDINQYSLGTAHDISTAGYDGILFSVAAQDTIPNDVVFSNDGYKFYIIGNANDTIYQYSV